MLGRGRGSFSTCSEQKSSIKTMHKYLQYALYVDLHVHTLIIIENL